MSLVLLGCRIDMSIYMNIWFYRYDIARWGLALEF